MSYDSYSDSVPSGRAPIAGFGHDIEVNRIFNPRDVAMVSGIEKKNSNKVRCWWCEGSDLYMDYHDKEWGVPVYDDRGLFEFIVLEGAQAGLSWATILKKREAYRAAFNGFDPARVARFTAAKVERLLRDPSIVRNRLKIESAVTNARALLAIVAEFDSFSNYQWRFVEGRPQVNRWHKREQVPSRSKISDQFSKDLKARGFRFVGTTIVYAHMQAVGMVNDHLVTCFRHSQLAERASHGGARAPSALPVRSKSQFLPR